MFRKPCWKPRTEICVRRVQLVARAQSRRRLPIPSGVAVGPTVCDPNHHLPTYRYRRPSSTVPDSRLLSHPHTLRLDHSAVKTAYQAETSGVLKKVTWGSSQKDRSQSRRATFLFAVYPVVVLTYLSSVAPCAFSILTAVSDWIGVFLLSP